MFAQKLGSAYGRLPVGLCYDLFGVPKTQHHMTLIGQAAKALGWERKQLRCGGSQQWCYVRGDQVQRGCELEITRTKDGTMIVVQPQIPDAEIPF